MQVGREVRRRWNELGPWQGGELGTEGLEWFLQSSGKVLQTW